MLNGNWWLSASECSRGGKCKSLLTMGLRDTVGAALDGNFSVPVMFHPWPDVLLLSVASKYLAYITFLPLHCALNCRRV